MPEKGGSQMAEALGNDREKGHLMYCCKGGSCNFSASGSIKEPFVLHGWQGYCGKSIRGGSGPGSAEKLAATNRTEDKNILAKSNLRN
jgi:hypothetical protein